ncbi:MAG: sigma-70 family RNA polymerase sigma factor [Anaerolineae bacterium]
MKPEHDDPDLPLLQGIVAGDAEAFDQLYRRHHGYLMAYLLRVVKDRAAAEDALQNLMLAVWRGAGGFRRLSLVRTWMVAIARRQSLKALRARDNLPLDENAFASGDDLAAAQADRDRIERLRAALPKLPAYEREVLELVYDRDMTLAQAADQLGIPVNTVKSRLYRARANLRKWMAEDDDARDV